MPRENAPVVSRRGAQRGVPEFGSMAGAAGPPIPADRGSADRMADEVPGTPMPTSTHNRLIAIGRPSAVGDAGREAGSPVEYGIMRTTVRAHPSGSIRERSSEVLRANY